MTTKMEQIERSLQANKNITRLNQIHLEEIGRRLETLETLLQETIYEKKETQANYPENFNQPWGMFQERALEEQFNQFIHKTALNMGRTDCGIKAKIRRMGLVNYNWK